MSQASEWSGAEQGLRVAKSGLRGVERNLSGSKPGLREAKFGLSEEQSEDSVKARAEP